MGCCKAVGSQCKGDLPWQRPHPPALGYHVILDLDNPLVYAHKDLISSEDFSMEFDDDAPLHIMKRLGVDEFLGKVSNVYDIVVFSAAEEKYVNLVVDHLDPTGRLVSRRLHYGNCVVLKDGTKVKNLDHVRFRDFKRVVALDDIIDFYQGHQESVVVAPKFEGSKDDHFLADVAPFLLARILPKLPIAGTLDNVWRSKANCMSLIHSMMSN
ncbi:probable phosphatase PSR2 [Selaginella moellendorffii]|uniref:probable phosphatase PSR2 n=1 Tax=Selaginella moellendorffii TaxID=88036 RepID=UPI000D1C936E|nr:probable phosphatase PSR2 [Selaginella moellendorffii]|eukprot:XP_024520944.1 probable phosphatase PSR2 [Selaginella moellendorffii]